MPHLKKAELIEGVVYLTSSVRARSHGQPHAFIMGWLGVYCAATPGVGLADNTTVRLDLDKSLSRMHYSASNQSREDNRALAKMIMWKVRQS